MAIFCSNWNQNWKIFYRYNFLGLSGTGTGTGPEPTGPLGTKVPVGRNRNQAPEPTGSGFQTGRNRNQTYTPKNGIFGRKIGEISLRNLNFFLPKKQNFPAPSITNQLMFFLWYFSVFWLSSASLPYLQQPIFSNFFKLEKLGHLLRKLGHSGLHLKCKNFKASIFKRKNFTGEKFHRLNFLLLDFKFLIFSNFWKLKIKQSFTRI